MVDTNKAVPNAPQESSPFEKFVNTELPKRVSIDLPESGNLPPNKVLVTTGVGLGVEVKDADEAGEGVVEHTTVINSTEKVIPKDTPLAAAAVKGDIFDLASGKLYVRPMTVADTVCIGVAKTDIGASDIKSKIFSQGLALLRGMLVLSKKPDMLDTVLADMDVGKTLTVYANGENLSCNTELTIPVGQIVSYREIPSEDGKSVAEYDIHMFVTLQGSEYAGSVGGGAASKGTIVIEELLGTSQVTGEDGQVTEKTSYQVVDKVVGLDTNLAQPQLLSAALIEQSNPTYLAIKTLATLEQGNKLRVINKADNTSVGIKTPPVITLENGLKHMTIEFEDPTQVYSLAEQAGESCLHLQVIHPAGGKSDVVSIKTKAASNLGDISFELPAGQTAVKYNDAMKVIINAPVGQQIAKVCAKGSLLFDKTNVGNEQHEANFNSALDPEKFSDKVTIPFKVFNKELSDKGFLDLEVTLKDGSIIKVKTNELGNVQNVNWVQVDNLIPTISVTSIQYPDGQTALKSSEQAVVTYSVENCEKLKFETPDDQIKLDSTEQTVDSAAQHTIVKNAARFGGDYNVTDHNLNAIAVKESNGSSCKVSSIVNISDSAAKVELKVFKPVMVPGKDEPQWEPSKDNRVQSSPAEQASWKFFKFVLVSDQALKEVPQITLNGSGKIKAEGVAKSSTEFEYLIRVEDSEPRGDGHLVISSAKNQAGVTVAFKQNASKENLDKYTVAGFSKRTLKVQAWPNRKVEIGVSIVDPANLKCTNLSKGVSGSLNCSYVPSASNKENHFTLVNAEGSFDTKGAFWYNCDQSNALSNTSGMMQIELEEI